MDNKRYAIYLGALLHDIGKFYQRADEKPYWESKNLSESSKKLAQMICPSNEKGTFGYNLERTLDEIRPTYKFDVSCQGTVPEAMIAFLESNDFEDAIRKGISLGGDSDTLTCITGGIAQAFYGEVPQAIQQEVLSILDERLRKVTLEFDKRFCRRM